MPPDEQTDGRLRKGLARLETLHRRNQRQAEGITTVAGQMADHATQSIAELEKQARAGDPRAQALVERALQGRAEARRTEGAGRRD